MNFFGRSASKIVVLNFLLFVALVIVHELGHFAVGSALGCTANGVSLFGALTSSVSMSCARSVNRALIESGGILATTAFIAMLLPFRFGRKMLFITSGMSLVLGSLDFPALSYVLITSGMSMISFGEYSFSMSLLGSRINITQDKLTV